MSARSVDAHDGDGGEPQEGEIALEKAAVEALRSEEFGADELNLISEDDMRVFGLNPLTDSLNLVSCNVCQKPVIDRQFPAHYKRCTSSRDPEQPGTVTASPNIEERKGNWNERWRFSRTQEHGQRKRDKIDSPGDACAERMHVSNSKKFFVPESLGRKRKVEGQLPSIQEEVSKKRDRSACDLTRQQQSEPKRKSAQACTVVPVEVSPAEVRRRPGLRDRKRDGSAVCSGSVERSKLPAHSAISRIRKQVVSALTVVYSDQPERPAQVRPFRTRRRYIKALMRKGGEDERKASSPLQQGISVDTACPLEEGGQPARATKRHQKQDTEPDHSELGGLLTRVGGRRKHGRNPGDKDARPLRRQRREGPNFKDQTSLENSSKEQSSDNDTKCKTRILCEIC